MATSELAAGVADCLGVAGYPVALPPPTPPRFGLVQSAVVLPDTDEHWIGGVEARRWYTSAGMAVWTADGDATSSGMANPKPSPVREMPTVVSRPFSVIQSYSCGRGYIESEALFQQRAQQAFLAFEARQVEREVWAGAKRPDNAHFGDAHLAVLHGGTAVKPNLGLALLEQAIADSDIVNGLIHMRSGLAAMYGSTLLSVQANTMQSVMGTQIVAGSGYPGTGQNGASITADREWAIATGPVVVIRSGITVLPMLNRQTNEWVVTVERDYVVLWDTQLQAAVLVDKAA